jgi:hypothetical protein
MNAALSGRELMAMHDRGPIPNPVFSAMYTAAWARAEHCPLMVVAGRLEPNCWRDNPSDSLWCAVAQSMGNLVGCLGWAVPLMISRQEHVAYAASWPPNLEGWN